MQDDLEYVCPACGERIVAPFDPSGGSRQEYVEDCPVCCRALVLVVRLGRDGTLDVDARAE